MAKTFDFNKIKEKTMPVILSDEDQTTLILKTPNKALWEDLEALYKEIENSDDEEEVSDTLYMVTAKIMSRNKNNITITPEHLKEMYDDRDYIMAFLAAYTEFIEEYKAATNSKN